MALSRFYQIIDCRSRMSMSGSGGSLNYYCVTQCDPYRAHSIQEQRRSNLKKAVRILGASKIEIELSNHYFFSNIQCIRKERKWKHEKNFLQNEIYLITFELFRMNSEIVDTDYKLCFEGSFFTIFKF